MTPRARPSKPGLVITRKPGERVTIGNDTVVEIDRVRGTQVKLRIVAPADQAIHRDPPTSRPGP